jgi:hypothetical protein
MDIGWFDGSVPSRRGEAQNVRISAKCNLRLNLSHILIDIGLNLSYIQSIEKFEGFRCEDLADFPRFARSSGVE